MWSDIFHSPPAVAAIFAAIFAFVSGVFGPYVQYRIGKRQAAAAQRVADAAMIKAKCVANNTSATLCHGRCSKADIAAPPDGALGSSKAAVRQCLGLLVLNHFD